jgi:glycosyltransferase involved in cell wall biosynthesis
LLKGQDIVCISSADWDAPLWTNKQHLMSRLAESNRILYVESLGLRTPTLAPQDRQRIKRRVKHYFLGPRKVPGKNVYVLSPLVIPYYRTAALRALNGALLRREVLQAVHRLKIHEPILWSYIPNAYALTHHLNEKLVVYHCVDDLSAVAGVPKAAVKAMEDRFLRQADAVLTTSRALYEARVAVNPNTFLFTNVADADHFGKALRPELAVAPEVARLPRPVAGYVGALDAYQVDFPFLAEVARHLADWSFVLIGPVGQGQPSTDLGDLRRLPNVHLTGYVEYQQIPSYLKGIDVALIPHRLSDYTQSSFPMKLYEYLAAGRPVVSTPLPAIADVALVRFAATPAEFARQMIAAHQENSPEAVERRVAEAQKHTWESRIQSFDEVLERVWRQQQRRD